ncbi:uncharacterized protein LOC5500053 [Nematostella vectensis]|uniref:uncharacterized protein LOC5500053 n=1 Tax=Nematostella vectensis TaxID=45351 RepID=UPI00138FD590|nr:uncharacterized protein LOC5500053 [Nematostella vectensis]
MGKDGTKPTSQPGAKNSKVSPVNSPDSPNQQTEEPTDKLGAEASVAVDLGTQDEGAGPSGVQGDDTIRPALAGGKPSRGGGLCGVRLGLVGVGVVAVTALLGSSGLGATLYGVHKIQAMKSGQGWSEWTKWSSCSALPCGRGVKSRVRICQSSTCSGEDNEETWCYSSSCSDYDTWSNWSNWTTCSVTCSGGVQSRTRFCLNPFRGLDRPACRGDNQEERICNNHPCKTTATKLNGGWSSWSNWTACNETCGGGVKSRNRTCTRPSPRYGGADCQGEGDEIKSCRTFKCQGLESYSNLTWIDDHYLEDLYRFLVETEVSASANWRPCYQSYYNAGSARMFHSGCNSRGPTVTIVYVGDFVFGGYTDVSWGSLERYKTSRDSFLFILYGPQGYKPTKLPLKTSPCEYAIYDDSSYGPTFGGGHDLRIDLDNPSRSFSSPYSYERPPGCYNRTACGTLVGSQRFRPDWVEVFYDANFDQGGLTSSSILTESRGDTYWLYNQLRPVQQSPSSTWRLCYRAGSHGWAASTFHSYCNNMGPTVTIVKTSSYIFGGYTDQSWTGCNCWKSSSKSFMFTIYNTFGYKPAKLPLRYSPHGHAIYDNYGYGPTFGGGHDLYITNYPDRNTNSYSSHTYDRPRWCTSDSCDVLAGSTSFYLSDIEVFYEVF